MKLSTEMRLALIEDHDQHPRYFGVLAEANRIGGAYNPRCGDKYSVYLQVENGVIQQAQYHGYGCTVSNASASMMIAAIQGRNLEEIRKIMTHFEAMTSGEGHTWEHENWEELLAFEGIHQNPIKHRCARLAWEALEKALRK